MLDGKYQTKFIVHGGHEFVLHGLPGDDRYFANVWDNLDSEFLTVCRKFVAEDAVCIDIGANIGIKTVYLSLQANRGRVIAVEAGKKNSECLSPTSRRMV